MVKSIPRSGPRPNSFGLARVLSKRGICSRSEAERLILAGKVSVGGRVCRDPERRTALEAEAIVVAGRQVPAQVRQRRYLMLNKPRGLVTTRHDERGRPTVYDCLAGTDAGWLAPVGRLDQASEGLLLFSNDSAWAAAITGPESGVTKTYHVQIDRVADAALVSALGQGLVESGELLRSERVAIIRSGGRTSWLEIELTEGRNRQIRRMLAVLGVSVLRLVRVAIADLRLGDLGKGQWRWLTGEEAVRLAPMSGVLEIASDR